LEFDHPLFNQVRRTEHSEGVNLTAIHQLAQNEPSFNRLSNSNIISNEKAWHRETQRHEERDELIYAWLERKLGGGAEWAGTATERETQGICEQRGLGLHRDSRVGWEIETSGFNRIKFQSRIKEGGIGFRS
jgi:hypothetical protein